MLASLIPTIAREELGVQEVDGTNCGPRVDQYKAATTLPPHEGWSWCAAFVDWVVQEAMKQQGGEFTFQRPTTAAAFGLEHWSLAQDNSTQTRKTPTSNQVAPGDIVIYAFSHTGFAVTTPDENGNFHAIEGNTNDAGSREGGGVFLKLRNVTQLRSRVRFMV